MRGPGVSRADRTPVRAPRDAGHQRLASRAHRLSAQGSARTSTQSASAWGWRRSARRSAAARAAARVAQPRQPSVMASVQAATEGIALSAFSADRTKRRARRANHDQARLSPCRSRSPPSGSRHRARPYPGESSNVARELSNEPSTLLTPAIFAGARPRFAARPYSVEILGHPEIEELAWGCCSASRVAAPNHPA